MRCFSLKDIYFPELCVPDCVQILYRAVRPSSVVKSNPCFFEETRLLSFYNSQLLGDEKTEMKCVTG